MMQKTKLDNAAKTKALLIPGVLAGPLFITVVLVHGVARSDYNSLLYPLSSLSIGKSGWIQISNFIVTGTLLVLFSIGLKNLFNAGRVKFRGALLVGLVGIGLIGAGIFVTDPVFGYPVNEPLKLRQFTFHGHLHDLFSMLVFICLPWACFGFRRNFIMTGKQRWAIYSAFTGYAMITTFIFASIGFRQISGFVNYAGLIQRLCVSVGLTWMTVLSLHLLKKSM